VNDYKWKDSILDPSYIAYFYTTTLLYSIESLVEKR
jgi:hypothetical protein